MKRRGGVQKVVLGILVGATVGMALFRWLSPLIGEQCLIICDPFRAIAAGAAFGGVITFVHMRAGEEKQRLLEREGGVEILKRRRQRRALWIGALFFCLMAIFPPWSVTTVARSGDVSLTDASHYRFIWRPPSVEDGVEAASVDVERLLVGWAVVGVLTGAAIAGAELGTQEPEETG